MAMDKCLTEIYNRVNYNAGCTDLNNPCYKMEFVKAVVVDSYARLLSEEKIDFYDRVKQNQNKLYEIEDAVSKDMGKDSNLVKAVLYNMYYGILDGERKTPDDFKDCAFLIHKPASKTWWFVLGGLIFAGGVGLFLTKDKWKNKRKH